MAGAIQLRAITSADIVFVAQLFEQMDEEDAELAQEAMADGAGSVFSLAEKAGRPVGFVGVTPIDDTASCAWLSYTAFFPQVDRYDMADIFTMLAEQSREAGLTRLVAMEADRAEGARAGRHDSFLQALGDAGFERATHLPDFYEPGEGAIYLVKRLDFAASPEVIPEDRPILFTEVFEHEESDGAYVLDWTFSEAGSSEADLHDRIVWARDEEEARMLVCSAPSNALGFDRLMATVGFREAGRLDGFYAPGVDEVQYLLRLN